MNSPIARHGRWGVWISCFPIEFIWKIQPEDIEAFSDEMM